MDYADSTSSSKFVSLRWRLGVPLALLAVVFVVIAALTLNAISSDAPANALTTYRDTVLDRLLRLAAPPATTDALARAITDDMTLATLRSGSPLEFVALDANDQPLAVTSSAVAAAVYHEGMEIERGEQAYRGTFFPFAGGRLGVFVPSSVLAVVMVGQQLALGLLALLGALLVVGAVIGAGRIAARIERVTRTAQALRSGDVTARTGMTGGDEVGKMGQALDKYAQRVQERHDSLRQMLRQQRRELAHFASVLEALPDGVVLQDRDGRVLFVNERAKALLGSVLDDETELTSIAAVVNAGLGVALAPGIYALGDPQQVTVNGRMVTAQVAALTSEERQTLGRAILLHDITDDVRRERARDALIERLSAEVEQPLAQVAQSGALKAIRTPPLSGFAREITRNAIALQKIIVEMRELTGGFDPHAAHTQQPLALETLIWSVANEWRQVAQAANLTMKIVIEKRGLFVLGDERRLRWAIGNLMDNAIKYTPAGGMFSLEVKGDDDGKARMRIRDTGVGITPEDMAHAFTRFYRGKPVTADGAPLYVPGTGQGLSVARDIIKAHGGSIELRSKVGVGTAVYFTLPLTAPVGLELPAAEMEPGLEEGETVIVQPRVPISLPRDGGD